MELNLDLNAIILEKAKEIALQQVEAVVEQELETYNSNLDEFVQKLVEAKVDKMVEKDSFNLEDAVTKGISEAIMPWITNNMYLGDLKECIKNAILIKMKDFSLDELISLVSSLKTIDK